MQGSCFWPSTSRRWVAVIIRILCMMVHLGVFTLQLDRLDPCFLRVMGSWGCLITRKNAGIVAFAVLGTFSVVLSAFLGFFWLIFLLHRGFLGALGSFQGALGALLGALLGLCGAILTSQPDPPSFFGALSRVQEALGGVLGALLGLFGVILTFKQEPPSFTHMKNRY